MIIFKIWPVWLPSLRYHDQYLMSSMISDGVDTFFFSQNILQRNMKNLFPFLMKTMLMGGVFTLSL